MTYQPNLPQGTPRGLADEFRKIGATGRRLTVARPPATATSSGSPGQVAWDASYLYVCVAANTWRRVAIASW
jgi:hypothetical protein